MPRLPPACPWPPRHHTLDVQYYLFHTDTSGKMVIAALLAAAERGVRVRLLIDDIDTADKELRLATLNAHPTSRCGCSIPFTPAAPICWSKAGRHCAIAYVSTGACIQGLHRRQPAGHHRRRNIGDEYFDAHHNLAFVDLDVVAAGAIVDSLSQSFDQYWNSEARCPPPPCRSTLRTSGCSAPSATCSSSHRTARSEYGLALTAADPIPKLLAGKRPAHRPRDLIVDPPEKALNPNESLLLLIGQLAGYGSTPLGVRSSSRPTSCLAPWAWATSATGIM